MTQKRFADLYDLLHHLVDKTAWFTEQDLKDAHEAVNEANPNFVPAETEAQPVPPVLDPQAAADLAAAQAATLYVEPDPA